MKRAVVLILLTILCASAMAQKVKYKDLYYLLSGKKFEEAEPFLKQFLAEDKNKDHPNANFQMGVVYELKADKADIFREHELVASFSDSAIYFYSQAKSYIDDKEVKRNDEYYEEFEKRDMRTGKVSVKAFDIHFAIDEKIELIEKRKKNVEIVNKQLLGVIRQYNGSRKYFMDLKSETDQFNELLLRANLKTIGVLDYLVDSYDSFQTGFNQMKYQLEVIPNSGYSQQLRIKSIENFSGDGEDESDFLEEDIVVWNYAEWAKSTKILVLTEIMPLKEAMSLYDKELDDLLIKAKSDSAVFTTRLDELKNSWDSSTLLKYDKDPLPTRLFNLRLAELEYFNSMLDHREFDNTSDYTNRINLLNQDIGLINRVETLIQEIVELDIDPQLRKYTDFVENRYGGYLGLDKFLKQKIEDTNTFLDNSNEKLEALNIRNSYMLVNEKKYFIDSIFYSSAKDTLDYFLKFSNEYFSGGYQYVNDTIQGYALEVNPQRTTNIFYEFPLDSVDIGERPRVLGQNDPSGQVFYLLFYGDTLHVPLETQFTEVPMDSASRGATASLSADTQQNLADSLISESIEEPMEKSESVEDQFKVIHPAILVKIYRVDGVSWKVPLHLKDTPERIRINDLGEIVIDEVSEEEGRPQGMLIVSNKDGSVKVD